MNPLIPTLRIIPIFRELDDQEFERLAAITSHHSFQRKANVFMQGENRHAVFFACKGIIKIYKTDVNGNEQIVSFQKKGNMFPHTGFFDQSPYPATAEVVEPAELIVIPLKQFEQLMLETPTIAVKVMRVMGEKIRDLQTKLQEFVTHDINHRVISFLFRLAQEHGSQNKEQIIINLPLTHQEFANMVGTTRETVNRIFNQLKKEGIISMNRKKIVILDPKALQNYLVS
ncbi:Crp/Fnr family transcriptional regulator [Brevibacillus ginsengisoli]|uniref:Crp/Fnr family transcriptional regulator n=1 Tax=Brevibacillus ginsengisoli TaxID=363854 RepID=UPI003CE7871D